MENIARFTSAEKAVATIVAIGKPAASQLLSLLSRDEIKTLIAVSRRMKTVPQEGLEMIAREFEAEFTKGTGLMDSSKQMEAILSDSLEEADLAAIMDTDSSSSTSDRPKQSVWTILAQTEPRELASFLEIENEHVAAYILSKLGASQSAEITKLLEPELRNRILVTLLSIKEPSTKTITIIEETLLDRFGNIQKSDGKKGVSNLASILNELDKDKTEDILNQMSKTSEPEAVRAVKSLLFRFEDLAKLDLTTRATILDSIPTDTITMALRDADNELVEVVLSSISQRTRRMIEVELRSKISVRSTDIAAARKVIVNRVLELASSGQIVLATSIAEAA